MTRIDCLPSIPEQLAEYHAAAHSAEQAALEVSARPKRDGPGRPAGSARGRILDVFEQANGKWLCMRVIRERAGGDICPRTIRAYVSDMHGDRQILRMGEPGRYLYRLPQSGKGRRS